MNMSYRLKISSIVCVLSMLLGACTSSQNIPATFQGEWETSAKACPETFNDTRVVITGQATELTPITDSKASTHLVIDPSLQVSADSKYVYFIATLDTPFLRELYRVPFSPNLFR